MKSFIKKISLFVITIFSFFVLYSQNVNAISFQTSYINVGSPQSFYVNGLTFSDITFKDLSSTSTKSFGLSGFVNNTTKNTISYTYSVYYYDSNYNLLAKKDSSFKAKPGTNNFNQMFNLGFLKGHSVQEISYYYVSIEIIDDVFEKNATPSKTYPYSNFSYVLDQYDVNITVNENNTLDVIETITAYFRESKHGIIRTIPLKNTVTRLDGTTSKNYAQVTNVDVDNEYTTSKNDGVYKLKIGSAGQTVTGTKKYTIKYTYNLGKDSSKDYDELYYNIIGNEWDTAIGNITFTINMPKDFDSSKLGFSSGKLGSTDNSNVKYTVNNNTISGSYEGILSKEEALTIRCELPEGYFVNADYKIGTVGYLIILVPLLCLIVSILLWYKYGRDEKVVETVEFYPPKGFNSLEIGFLYHGRADNKDVTSLLVYLANLGYIKISETEKKSILAKHTGFKITKLKDYNGEDINEKIFLEGLFNKKPTLKSLFGKKEASGDTEITEVTSADLYDNFYKTMGKILANVNSKENIYKIFEKSSSNKSTLIYLMIIITYCMITIPPFVMTSEINLLLSGLLLPSMGFIFLPHMIVGKTPMQTKMVAGLLIILFGIVPCGISVFPILQTDVIFLVGYILGIIYIFGMIACLEYLPKRTPYGNEILGKLRGFKNFLETAEKNKLEAMVTEMPTYFYDVLPYAYVLGVSNTWIKKFETISMKAPSWYDSPNVFDMNTFETFVNNTMNSAQNAMSSRPSSDSSSGGGSSGGGSGGGGGSSW